MARANHVTVSVTYFVPCADTNHSAFGFGGSYETVSGMVLRAEQDTLTLLTENGEQRILVSEIRDITGTVFERDREIELP